MFGVNPAMVGFMLRSKLDEILSGNIPDGLRVKEKTAERIVLVPSEGTALADGVEILELKGVVRYNGVIVELCHE